MIAALALALVASTSVGAPANPPAVARSHDDPPIQLTLSSNNTFVRGQRARVYIQSAEDGYVIVLRADAQGHVRVLFPLDPNEDARTPGGRKFEVRGHGDREAFTVDDDEGTGVVLAAWSENPFTFDGLVNGDQWDLSALSAQQTGADREAGLIEAVQGMAGENHFEYDVATYTVHSTTAYNDRRRDDRSSDDGVSDDRAPSDDRASDDGDNHSNDGYNGGSYSGPAYPYGGPYYGPYSGLSLSLGVGAYCDGFYWSAWGCGPFYDPFYYPVRYGYRPYVYRSFGLGFGHSYRRPYVGRGYSGYGRGSYGSVQPRVRTSGGFSSMRERTGTRFSPPASRGVRDRGYAPRGSARSAPSAGRSGRGGLGGSAPRSSGGYSRGSGGSSRGISGGGYSRSGGGGEGRRSGGGGGGGRRH